ncbi:MAG: hypothetical protein ACLR6S_14440 [Lacrimispora saccharolytica]
MKESKNEKFVRIAEARTNKIISMIKLLGNCSNKNTYEYSKEDIKKIFDAIESELKCAKMRFEASEGSDKEFKLR